MTENAKLVAELRTWEAAENLRGEVRSLAKRAADEIERLQGIIENMREIRATLAIGGDP